MAGEQILLSRSQIATFTNANVTFPGGTSTIQLKGLVTLGSDTDLFYLVCSQGNGDMITHGQLFTVFPAVTDASGTLVPGPTAIVARNFSTPDAYNNTAA